MIHKHLTANQNQTVQREYLFVNLTLCARVGQHPHRGFETVTIVYDGEVSHRDSTGKGGTIKSGDVQ